MARAPLQNGVVGSVLGATSSRAFVLSITAGSAAMSIWAAIRTRRQAITPSRMRASRKLSLGADFPACRSLIDPAGKESAVDYDSLSRDKTGSVRSKKYRSPHEFFELTEARHWRSQQKFLTA